jgi:hypothetical protein
MMPVQFGFGIRFAILMNASGGSASDEDDEPVGYYLGNLIAIAIGPTKSGKTTAINNLLLIPCFGNLALTTTSSTSASIAPTSGIGFTVTSSSARCLRQRQTAAGVNTICSAAGWATQDQRPKIAALRSLLYLAVGTVSGFCAC